MTKRILIIIVLLAQLVSIFPKAYAQNPEGEKRLFMVSAYYSPLPDQRFYIRGSYEADKRLNGRGTNGADGTPVYVGMLAAPKTYAFGTRINLFGLGIGEVHDRGGAIVAGRNYDRIDVWMGRGEEGLSRALNWGMRLIEGEVYDAASEIPSGIDFTWVSSTLPASTISRMQARNLLNPETFAKPITQLSSKQDISGLQEALRLFGYYHGEVNGTYGKETSEAVLTFQLDEGVILNDKVTGAGLFGPKTRQALKSKIENFNSRVTKEQNRLRENLKALSVGLGKKSQGNEVVRLQQMLWELGYYKGELNGKYDSGTMDAVLAFQKEYDVVQNDWEKGAGYFGKKTHEALVSAVDQKAKRLTQYPQEMQGWVPAKIDLPKLANLNFVPETQKNPRICLTCKLETYVPAPVQSFTQDLGLNDKGEEVKKLQNILIKEGYLSKELNTATFGIKTQEALIRFQLEKGIIKKAEDRGAGQIGPKTRAALNAY